MEYNFNNFILIFLIFLIIMVLYYYTGMKEPVRDISFSDDDANYQYLQDIQNKPCNDYNCQMNSTVNDKILLIANDDDNNYIFKLNNDLYKLQDNKLILSNDEDITKLTYYIQPINVPIDHKTMTLQIKITHNGYQYVGTLSNKFYRQQYLVYEKPYDDDNELDHKLFYYNLVNIIDNQYVIAYELPPRDKITKYEGVWASYGSFQIGPLIFE
jgi:hypothetical protein